MHEVEFSTAVLAAAVVSAISFELRRDTVPLWRLFAAPIFAIACLLTLPAEPVRLEMYGAALALGSIIGCMRGLLAPVRVDHVWRLVRLGPLYDGIAVALLLAVVSGADIAPVQKLVAGTGNPIAAAGAMAAGYLIGRSIMIGLRTRRAGHQDMRPGGR